MSDSPYQYFDLHELSCSCCGDMAMVDEFMAKVVAMRRELGFPFVVTSAYRCPEHNNQVSTTGADGPHTTGRALDVAVSYEQAHRFLKSALEYGMMGIGINQRGSSRFIHIDDLKTAGRPRVWSY